MPFVRVGGCDYRCTWCDSLHAVLPEAVREAPRMTAAEVVEALDALGAQPEWVTLSGGNPALFELGDLVARLHRAGRKVAVETQGSIWREWLAGVDLLTISPKPPSSGMASDDHAAETEQFLDRAVATDAQLALKIVVFHDEDYGGRTACASAGRSFRSTCRAAPIRPDPARRMTRRCAASRIATVGCASARPAIP